MKRIQLLLFCFLPVCILCGCIRNPAAINQFRDRRDAWVIPAAKEWVEENVDGAENVTAQVLSGGPYKLIIDAAEGTYEKNGQTYAYYLNIGTGDFLTNEAYERYAQLVNDYAAAELPDGFRCTACRAWADGDSLEVTYIVMTDIGKSNDPDTYCTQTVATNDLLRVTDDQGLSERARRQVDTDPMYVFVTVDDFSQVEAVFGDLNFLREHSNWELHIQKPDTRENYITAYWDGYYCLLRYYPDKNGEIVPEYIEKSLR